MGGKRRFRCWLCYDTGFVQDWDRPIESGEPCSCSAGERVTA